MVATIAPVAVAVRVAVLLSPRLRPRLRPHHRRIMLVAFMRRQCRVITVYKRVVPMVSCTVTSFYTCDNHTHSYPSPPPPPPPPSLCPANAWTNCGNTSSDATTCGGGHTYYTCNPSAVAYHGDSKSCRRGGCSNTWSNCQRAPWCDAWPGNKCWAE